MTYLTDRQKEIIGVGMKYPVTFSSVYGRAELSDGVQRINEAICLRLSIRRVPWPGAGEMPMHPEMGSMLWMLLHNPINEVLRSAIMSYVIESLRQEKRIIVWNQDVTFLSEFNLRNPWSDEPLYNEDAVWALLAQGHEIVSVQYSIVKDQQRGNCVYPFYFDEDMKLAGYGYVYPKGAN
jgi:phage baseplate assembly protein W